MIDAIWSDMGLRYPPAAERLPPQSTATIARADRLAVLLPEQTPCWCLLHELAHAMTSTADGRTDGHGATFVGVYVRLLTRYLRMDEAAVLRSLADARIEFVRDARPVFLDT